MQIGSDKRLANVLLIDDSILEYKLASALIKMDNVHLNFTAFQDGMQAIRFMKKEGEYTDAYPPDLILLDINMPIIDGREFLILMRDQLEKSSTPVVMYSGSRAAKDIEETEELGALSYMEKPLSFEKMQDVTNKASNLLFVEEDGNRYLCCRC